MLTQKINEIFGSLEMAVLAALAVAVILLYIPWSKIFRRKTTPTPTGNTPAKAPKEIHDISGHHKKRFDEFPWWAQMLVAYDPWIRTRLLPGIPTIFAGVMSICAAYATYVENTAAVVFFLILGLVGIAGTIAYIFFQLDTIKEDGDGKPQFALLEVGGLRLPITVDEGYVLGIPLVSRFIEHSKEQFNEDMVIESTKCHLRAKSASSDAKFYPVVSQALMTSALANITSGGSIKTTIGLTFELDWRNGWHILEYDNVGEQKGFLNIIRDAIEEDLREIGRRLTWLQATFATDLMSVHLIMRLTGVTHYEYQSVNRKLLDNPTPEFISAFLEEVRKNGLAYIGGLGVRIKRIQVKSVDPIGKLAAAAENAAVQEMLRIGLIENVDALVEAAERLNDKLNKDKTMTMKDIINTIQVDEEGSRVEKKIIELSANDINKLADILKGIIGGLKG